MQSSIASKAQCTIITANSYYVFSHISPNNEFNRVHIIQDNNVHHWFDLPRIPADMSKLLCDALGCPIARGDSIGFTCSISPSLSSKKIVEAVQKIIKENTVGIGVMGTMDTGHCSIIVTPRAQYKTTGKIQCAGDTAKLKVTRCSATDTKDVDQVTYYFDADPYTPIEFTKIGHMEYEMHYSDDLQQSHDIVARIRETAFKPAVTLFAQSATKAEKLGHVNILCSEKCQLLYDAHQTKFLAEFLGALVIKFGSVRMENHEVVIPNASVDDIRGILREM